MKTPSFTETRQPSIWSRNGYFLGVSFEVCGGEVDSANAVCGGAASVAVDRGLCVITRYAVPKKTITMVRHVTFVVVESMNLPISLEAFTTIALRDPEATMP